MKHVSVALFVLLCLTVSACSPGQLFGLTQTPISTPTLTPTTTSTPTLTYTPTLIPTSTPRLPPISGYLKADKPETPIANRRLVLCQRIEDSKDCVLMKSFVLSDKNGYFEFWDVPPGRYLLFYDSGWMDFDTGFKLWGGKTIKTGDPNWLEKNYYQPNSDGKFTIQLWAGDRVDRNWLFTRFQVKSPFFLATADFDVRFGGAKPVTFIVHQLSPEN